MKDQELEDLLGVVDGDEENECQRCHRLYLLRDGECRTKYCDQCAHEIVEENDL